MGWALYAGLAAACLGGYHVMIKLSSASVHQALGAFVLQGVALVVGGLVAGGVVLGRGPLEWTPRGLWWAAGAGLLVGVAELLGFMVFKRGAPVHTATAIMVGGSVALAAAIGIVALGEEASATRLLGIVLVVSGVALLLRT